MAWLAKTIVLRCGGIRLYREWMLFFLALDARRFFTASLWVETGKIAIQGNMTFNF